MSYIDRLNAITAQQHPPGSLTQPTEPPDIQELSVVSVPSIGAFPNARETLAAWYTNLVRLDPCKPPEGWTMQRWQTLYDDACWLYQNFASRAARDGWSADDLFGVLPARWGWGGLCDRLRGARNLKMGRDFAAWSVGGEREGFCRGGGDDLVASGLKSIWEITTEDLSKRFQIKSD